MRKFGRFLYKVTLVLLGITLAFSLTAGGLVFWVVKYPTQAWNFVHRNFLPADLKIQWEAMNFKGERKNWLHWDIEWHVKNLKIEKAEPFIAFPLDSVDVVFSLELLSPRTRLGFARIGAQASQPVRWTVSPGEEPEEPEPLNPYQKLYYAYLRYLHWANRYGTLETMEVDLKDIQLLGWKSETVTGRLSLSKPKSETEPKDILIELRMKGPRVESEINASVAMDNFNTHTPFLEASVKWHDEKFRLDGESKWAFSEERFTFLYKGKGAVPMEKGAIEVDPELAATVSSVGAELTLVTSVRGISGSLIRLNRVTGEYRMPFVPDTAWNDEPGTFKISGPVELSFLDKAMRAAVEKPCKCKLPDELTVTLQGRVFTKELASKLTYKLPVAEVSVQAESLRNKLFSADFSALVKVNKTMRTWQFEPDVDARLYVASFHDLKGLLESMNLTVPAPFDVLDGTVDIKAKGPVVLNKEGSRVNVSVKTGLLSEHQKIVTDTHVQLSLDPSFKSMDVVLDLKIQDFQVELPPLDPIAGMPALNVDPRFQLNPPPATAAGVKAGAAPLFKVRLSWAATTQRPGAIRLLSKYANPHIPLSMDLQRGIAGDVGGYVKMEPFQIQYLRRTLTVEQLRILADERDKAADFPVDGRVRVDQTQYAVFMEISGTLRAPFIKLTSEPELPRSDIISVLLFDRKQDQLAGGDAETAGQFEAAMADRAIGLLGLWAFASTPIRSFSYNASTKVYAATVQVKDGVTASVGTNWEEAAHLEVRKRISKRWMLTASWTPSERDETQTGRLVLQWEKRF